MQLPTQHSLWLDDPVTQALLSHIDKLIQTKTQQLFSARKTHPDQLSDFVADLELATALKSIITEGRFF